MKTYLSISSLFLLIRQFCLPNPFDAIAPGITIMYNEIPILLAPEVLNAIIEVPLWVITYIVAGFYYRDRTNPVVGSILYMVFYIVHTTLIEVILILAPRWWLIGIIVLGYIVLHIAILLLRNKIESTYIP